jgi:acetate kinase
MGIEIDPEANQAQAQEAIISTQHSKTKVVVIPTDEEYMIAMDTQQLLKR